MVAAAWLADHHHPAGGDRRLTMAVDRRALPAAAVGSGLVVARGDQRLEAEPDHHSRQPRDGTTVVIGVDHRPNRPTQGGGRFDYRRPPLLVAAVAKAMVTMCFGGSMPHATHAVAAVADRI